MGELAALASAMTWSATSVVMASLGTRGSPIALSALRLSIATLLLPIILFATGQAGQLGDVPLSTLFAIGGSGILAYAIGDTIYFRALNEIGVQRTFPITMALFIALTVIGGVLLLDEPFSPGLVGGALLIAVGVSLLVTAQHHKDGVPLRRGLSLAALALLGAVGVFWAAATLWLASASNDMGAVPTNTVRAATSAVVLLGVTLTTRPGAIIEPMRNRRFAATIVTVSLVGTLFGSLMYVYAVANAGAARAATLNATAPLMVLPLSIVFLGEKPTRQSLVGTLACVAGILLVVA